MESHVPFSQLSLAPQIARLDRESMLNELSCKRFHKERCVPGNFKMGSLFWRRRAAKRPWFPSP
jgi:hypothetical protein